MSLAKLSKTLVTRMVGNQNVNLQTRRTLYPFYLRYMVSPAPGAPRIPLAEKVIVYVGFVVGILGPPMYIMYDVNKNRPKKD